jgi:hypothetical protein
MKGVKLSFIFVLQPHYLVSGLNKLLIKSGGEERRGDKRNSLDALFNNIFFLPFIPFQRRVSSFLGAKHFLFISEATEEAG